MMISASFGTTNNQLAVFDLNKSEKHITADLYYYSSPLEKDAAKIPYLITDKQSNYQHKTNVSYKF